MTISSGDIEIRAAIRSDDTDHGGGGMGTTVLQNGAVGQLFGPVSELSRAYGNLSLRKVFGAVMNDGQDPIYGAYAIIAKKPEDSSVHATLCGVGPWADTRSDVVQRIESYLTPGILSQFNLVETQVQGSMVISLYCDINVSPPAIGETLYLVDNEGEYNQYSQYVRVQGVDVENHVFSESENSVYIKQLITVSLTSRLNHDFHGAVISRNNQHGSARVRETIISDAARFYGITTLAHNAAIGATSIVVDSVSTQIIPSAEIENQVVNQGISTINQIIQSGDSVSRSITTNWGGTFNVYLGSGFVPGSLSIVVAGVDYTDNRFGRLLRGGTICGSADYSIGKLSFSDSSFSRTNVTANVSYLPGAGLTRAYYTDGDTVTSSNRGYIWLRNLFPLPAPKTVTVSYLSGGDWYTLTDNGNGGLTGSAGIGVGTVNYTTGQVRATLAALPDVGSDIIYSWGVTTQTTKLGGSSVSVSPSVRLTLSESPCPGSLSVTWTSNGVSKTADDDGAGKLKILGTEVGEIIYGSGYVTIYPSPDGDTQISFEYTVCNPVMITVPGAGYNNVISGNISHPVRQNGFSMRWSDSCGIGRVAVDHGDGTLTGDCSNGVINYSTGDYSFLPLGKIPVVWYSNYGTSGVYCDQIAGLPANITVTIYSFVTSDAGSSQSEEITVPPSEIRMAQSEVNPLVSGSVVLRVGNRRYVDRDGTLYADVNPETGVGIVAGTVNYQTRTAYLSLYSSGMEEVVVEGALLQSVYGQIITRAVFHINGAPVRPGSLSLAVTGYDGVALSPQIDDNGLISGVHIEGAVDYQTGIVRLIFGDWIAVTGNEGEPWFGQARKRYNDTEVFKPYGVMASTISLDAVVVSGLPIDSSILGLDQVRLPPNGLVPSIRQGGLILVHKTTETVLEELQGGVAYELPSTRLEYCKLKDNTGVYVDVSRYSVNRGQGKITVPSLSGLSAPLVAEWRISDLVAVSDAQITGHVGITRQLSHNYPVGALVSSCLVIGDKQSRVDNMWEQFTWTGVWSDFLIGDSPPAQYDSANYPILTSNAGAITERFALIFTSSVAFKVVGEKLGHILAGDTTTECAPNNPVTNLPYFTVNPLGWGAGWSTGNVLRINLLAIHQPLWIARTVMPSQGSDEGHTICVEYRFDTVF